MRWWDGIHSVAVSLSTLREMVRDTGAWRAAAPWVAELETTVRLNDNDPKGGWEAYLGSCV